MSERRAKMSEILAARHWRPFRAAAEDALAEARVKPEGIRAMDRWLRHLEGHAGPVTPEAVLSFFKSSRSPNPIATLARAVHAVAPGFRHLPALSQALERRSRAYRPRKAGRARSRTPKVSVEPDALPDIWRDALASMRAKERRGCAAPAPSITNTIEMKLRQMAFSAGEARLPAEFEIPALSAYVTAMLKRGLAASTIGSTLDKLQTFGSYIGAPAETIDAIRSEQLLHEWRSRNSVKAKELFLAETGLTLDDVARTALGCFLDARVKRNARTRHMDWMRGALFAFTLARSLRPLDINRLVIGRTLQRDSEGWSLYTRARKNKYRLTGRLWDICTPYLDGAILLGADEAHLWDAYAQAEGRPLLAARDGSALGSGWATDQFRTELGRGVGIMRTLWHDLCASVGTERALQTALAICGQHDPRTASAYRTRMSERNLVTQGQDLLDGASREVGI